MQNTKGRGDLAQNFPTVALFELDPVRPPKSCQESFSATWGISCTIKYRSRVLNQILNPFSNFRDLLPQDIPCHLSYENMFLLDEGCTWLLRTLPKEEQKLTPRGARASTPVVDSSGFIKQVMFRFTPMVTAVIVKPACPCTQTRCGMVACTPTNLGMCSAGMQCTQAPPPSSRFLDGAPAGNVKRTPWQTRPFRGGVTVSRELTRILRISGMLTATLAGALFPPSWFSKKSNSPDELLAQH